MEKKQKTRLKPQVAWALPSAGLLLYLTLIPLGMLIVFSFMNRNIFAGQPWPGWTMNNIKNIFSFGPNASTAAALNTASFWKLMGKSLLNAGLVTIICIIMAYPSSWAIAKIVKEKNRGTFMMVVILPFFTSQLLLIYAMICLIKNGGLLLTMLDAIGLHNVQSMMYTNSATILVLVYEFLPYMILCLYSSLEGIGDNLVQASHILGANRAKTFINIVFPMSVPGLLSGVLLVFVPVAGTFVEPQLVGGTSSMIGSMIDNQYSASLNMGAGAVMACVLLIIMSVIMAVISAAAKHAQKAIGGDIE